jgi:hypothetical protein
VDSFLSETHDFLSGLIGAPKSNERGRTIDLLQEARDLKVDIASATAKVERMISICLSLNELLAVNGLIPNSSGDAASKFCHALRIHY